MSNTLLYNTSAMTVLRDIGMNPTQEEFDAATDFLNSYNQEIHYKTRTHKYALSRSMFLRCVHRENRLTATEKEIATHVRSEVAILEDEFLNYTKHQIASIMHEMFVMGDWLMRLPMTDDCDTFLARVYTGFLYLHPEQPLFTDDEEWPCDSYMRLLAKRFRRQLKKYGCVQEGWFAAIFRRVEIDWNPEQQTLAAMELEEGVVGPKDEPW